MKQSRPMFSGLVYLLLGGLFTYFAIQDVQQGGWGIFAILLVVLATFDLGSGLKMMFASLFHKESKK